MSGQHDSPERTISQASGPQSSFLRTQERAHARHEQLETIMVRPMTGTRNAGDRASWKLRAELARRCNSPRLSSGGDAARFIVRAILAVIHVIPRELRHLSPARSQVPKEEGSYLAHLHFLSSLGDAVPAVVAIDVFKGLVPGVADTPVYL